MAPTKTEDLPVATAPTDATPAATAASGGETRHGPHSATRPCLAGPAIISAVKPAMPIDKGLPGPGLLAHIIVSKYFDHLPLYRQENISQRARCVHPALDQLRLDGGLCRVAAAAL